jgi:hypothetical protein
MNGGPGLVDTQPPLLGCFHFCLPAVGAQPDEARTARGVEGQLPRAPLPLCRAAGSCACHRALRRIRPRGTARGRHVQARAAYPDGP